MTFKLFGLFAFVVALLSACGAGETLDVLSTQPPATQADTTTTIAPESETLSTIAAPGPTTTLDGSSGTVAIRLEPVNGVFIEGFEIGIRIETADGELLLKTLWSDYVQSLGDANIRAYYDSVLSEQVPAGPVVVLATVNIGAGPAPVTPDIDGPLNCRLKIDVPPTGQIEVEVSFDGSGNCLSQIA